MLSKEVENEIKRLSNLRQNKNKPKIEIECQAKLNIQKKQVNISSYFDTADDKKLGKSLLDGYLDLGKINNVSDLNNLADLIYNDVLKYNIRKQINKLNKNGSFPTEKLVKTLHEIEERGLKLKLKLRIDSENAETDLTKLEMLEDRQRTYIAFHRNEYSAVCEACGEMLLLRRRTKDFECLKHPAFSGRFLYNSEVIKDVEEKKITKEQAARYMRTSPDYIVWAIEHKHEIVSVDSVPQEKVDKFVKRNPFLKGIGIFSDKK